MRAEQISKNSLSVIVCSANYHDKCHCCERKVHSARVFLAEQGQLRVAPTCFLMVWRCLFLSLMNHRLLSDYKAEMEDQAVLLIQASEEVESGYTAGCIAAAEIVKQVHTGLKVVMC